MHVALISHILILQMRNMLFFTECKECKNDKIDKRCPQTQAKVLLSYGDQRFKNLQSRGHRGTPGQRSKFPCSPKSLTRGCRPAFWLKSNHYTSPFLSCIRVDCAGHLIFIFAGTLSSKVG